MSCSWKLANNGLRYIGERRDITWASLDEIDTYRADAENPDNPAIIVDSERLRERRRILKQIPSAQSRARRIDEYPYDSRDEIISDPNCDSLALVFLAGDCRHSLPQWQERAADAERSGRIALAMESLSFVTRCHIALGEFEAARASYDRASSFAGRFDRPSFQLLNLISVRYDFFFALAEGWEEIASIPGEAELFRNPPPEVRWAYAAACGSTAHFMALRGQPERALPLLGTVYPALQRGAPWGLVYSMTACDAAATLWLANTTEGIDVIETSLREKVLPADFRFPMRDARLSMARLCALRGRYDEAADWFAKARRVLVEAEARPLVAITDYDEGLTCMRRGGPDAVSSALRLFESAKAQFSSLGMNGWLRRLEKSRAQLLSGGFDDPAEMKTA